MSAVFTLSTIGSRQFLHTFLTPFFRINVNTSQARRPENLPSVLGFPSVGPISTITDTQSNVTTYGYDAHGNRTSATDALNHQTTFAYDSMDRLTKITYPDTTTTQFAYDIRGRRTSVTDENSKVTSYSYDDADRLDLPPKSAGRCI